ncbi:response regulator transcription factor [Actinophytocola sp.]|uniref:helix-turn-helix transcriptional regulator n=1 Tax=Actinophytocola sp. TaxID=1872138 RepID=UPI00389A5154
MLTGTHMGGNQADPELRIVVAVEAEPLGRRVDELLATSPQGVTVGRVNSAHAAPSSVDLGTDILVLALDEIDAPLSAWLRVAGDHGLRTLLLVEDEDTADLSAVAGMRNVGFVSLAGLDAAVLGEALRRVAGGELPMPPKLVHRLLSSVAEVERQRTLPRLTPREQQALVLMADGLSNKQLGRRLAISDHGAKRLVTNILAKLDCPNRTQAVALALREGLYDRCVQEIGRPGAVRAGAGRPA